MRKVPIVPSSWEIPQTFRDRLGDDFGRQRMMFHEEHLLLVLHAPSLPDDNEREGRLFWRKPNGEWTSTFKPGPGGLQKHLEEFETILNRFEELESVAATPSEYFHTIENLAPIRRTVGHLNEVLAEARKTVPADRELIVLRDKSYQLSRTAELSYLTAKNGMDFSIAKKTEEQANAAHQMSIAAHRLNLLAAFFFPLVTIASLFGTNLIPVSEDYAIQVLGALIVSGLLSGTILTYFIAKKPKARSHNSSS